MSSDARLRPPYPGLRPFRPSESDLFFGRKNCTQAMVRRLAATRFLAIVGSSGTGKSSLVFTGLMEALELGFMAKAGSHWRIISFRPGGAPLHNLARELILDRQSETKDGDKAVDDVEVELLHVRLKNNRDALRDWWRENYATDGVNLLVFVDQFEELFRYQSGRDEAEPFVARLLECRRSAQTEHDNIYVTITMRSEYLGASSLISGLAQAVTEGMFVTPRMDRKECEEAIKGPAAVCGVEIADDLVKRILNDLSDFAAWDDDTLDTATDHGWEDQLSRLARRADQLPLMQHALNRMWAAQSKDNAGPIKLTLADYDAIGGFGGALDKHANAILSEMQENLGGRGLAATEAVFRAVTTGTTAADAVRRQTEFGKLVEICGNDKAAVQAVIEGFGAEGRNFLTVTSELDPEGSTFDDETIVDISHESLIRQWRNLGEWVRAESQSAETYGHLRLAAKMWNDGKGSTLSRRNVCNARTWRRREKPNGAWASRYGGNYDLAVKFLRRSQERLFLRAAGITFGILAIAAATFEYTNIDFLKTGDATAALVDNELNAGTMTNGKATKLLKPFNVNIGPIYLLETLPINLLKPLSNVLSAETVHALVHLFDVQSQTALKEGRAVDAKKHAQIELIFAELLTTGNLPNPEFKLDMGSAHERLGDALRAEGKLDQEGALYQFTQYKNNVKELDAKNTFDIAAVCTSPSEDALDALHEFQLDRWESDERIGDVEKDLGHLGNALEQYNEMKVVAAQNQSQWGRDGPCPQLSSRQWEYFWHYRLAVTLENVGDALAAQGVDFAGANANYQSMQRYVAELMAAEQAGNFSAPKEQHITVEDLLSGKTKISVAQLQNTSWVYTLGLSYERLGDMSLKDGKFSEAEKSYETFLQLVRQLVRFNTDNGTANWDRAQAIANERLGDVFLQMAISDPATRLDNVVSICGLSDKDDEPAKSPQLAAEKCYEYDSHIAKKFDRPNVLDRRNIAISEERLGDAKFVQGGDLADALKHYQAYNKAAGNLVTVNAAMADFQRDLVLSFQRLGEALRANGQTAEANANFQKCSDAINDRPLDRPLKAYDPRNGLLTRDNSGRFQFAYVASSQAIQDYCKAQLAPTDNAPHPSR
jgi:tetratricopeptide (TPR) repeat protein